MIDLLSLEFMRNALLAALLVGASAPLVGVFLVQRGMSLIGDGMGHVALAGVGIGLLTSSSPVLTALVVVVLAAVAIELLRHLGRTSGDLALAVMFYGGLAAGVVIIAKAPAGSANNLQGYLFGALTTVSPSDLVQFAVLAAVLGVLVHVATALPEANSAVTVSTPTTSSASWPRFAGMAAPSGSRSFRMTRVAIS